ncbi:hypothetical protein JCM8202v2_004261 [Rhodotorula sphaerocarpa]
MAAPVPGASTTTSAPASDPEASKLANVLSAIEHGIGGRPILPPPVLPTTTFVSPVSNRKVVTSPTGSPPQPARNPKLVNNPKKLLEPAQEFATVSP